MEVLGGIAPMEVLGGIIPMEVLGGIVPMAVTLQSSVVNYHWPAGNIMIIFHKLRYPFLEYNNKSIRIPAK